ncbi:MAG: hypothetical protein KDH15_17780 [Rhodocyclaceae bacterium]|nr:hypothetical protein [Rhodocyclaceae bacterium]
MQRDTVPTSTHLRLQLAGLSIPGAGQLLSGQPLSDPRDRLTLARLLLTGAPSGGDGRPASQPPPVPPTPLPSIGPVLLGGSNASRRRADGTSDSFWLDLGHPATAGIRERLRGSGLSWSGIEALLAARALREPRDRAVLARWLAGDGGIGRGPAQPR